MRLQGDQEVHGLNLGRSSNFGLYKNLRKIRGCLNRFAEKFTNFSLFAKSGAVITILQQREGGSQGGSQDVRNKNNKRVSVAKKKKITTTCCQN